MPRARSSELQSWLRCPVMRKRRPSFYRYRRVAHAHVQGRHRCTRSVAHIGRTGRDRGVGTRSRICYFLYIPQSSISPCYDPRGAARQQSLGHAQKLISNKYNSSSFSLMQASAPSWSDLLLSVKEGNHSHTLPLKYCCQWITCDLLTIILTE